MIRRYEATDLGIQRGDQFLETLRLHTASWTSVERASWKVFTFLLEPSRDRAFAQVHLQLGGPGSAGQRTVVDATLEVLVVEAASGEWVISRLDLVEGSRVHNRSPPFRDITDAVGFHFNRSDVNGDLRQDIIDTRSSLIDSGLSVVDWDHDGADNLLFINQGGLRFTEASDALGITGTQYTYVAQFFDFDGDSDVDLFEGHDYGRNIVWDNTGDGFRTLADHPLTRHASNTMGITIGDWDNTGAWSVYVSNMYSHAGRRVLRLTESLGDAMRADLEGLAAGNQLFVQNADGGGWKDQAP